MSLSRRRARTWWSSLPMLAGFVVLTGTMVMAPAVGQSGSPCDRFGAGEELGRVEDPTLTEISGLAASRNHAEVIWAHNDSGGRAELSALALDGRALGVYPVDEATAVDWEDMAAGPGPDPDRSYLFIGDIGDNLSSREDITVYRVPEPSEAPDGTGGRLTGADAVGLRYPGGPSDAEALAVDPVSGDLFVLTKEVGTSRVLRAPAASLIDGAIVDMEQVAELRVGDPGPGSFLEQPGGLPGNLVTAADVSGDGSIVLVRTYRSVLAFVRPPGGPLAAAFAGAPCRAPQREEPQGEALAFAGDGSAYVTVSEGAAPPVYRFAVDPAGSVTPATADSGRPSTDEPSPQPSTAVRPTEGQSTDGPANRLPATGGDDDLLPAVAGAVGALLLAAAGVARVLRSRPRGH